MAMSRSLGRDVVDQLIADVSIPLPKFPQPPDGSCAVWLTCRSPTADKDDEFISSISRLALLTATTEPKRLGYVFEGLPNTPRFPPSRMCIEKSGLSTTYESTMGPI